MALFTSYCELLNGKSIIYVSTNYVISFDFGFFLFFASLFCLFSSSRRFCETCFAIGFRLRFLLRSLVGAVDSGIFNIVILEVSRFRGVVDGRIARAWAASCSSEGSTDNAINAISLSSLSDEILIGDLICESVGSEEGVGDRWHSFNY